MKRSVALFALLALLVCALASCGEDPQSGALTETPTAAPATETPNPGIYVTPTPVFPMSPDETPAPEMTPAPGGDMTLNPTPGNGNDSLPAETPDNGFAPGDPAVLPPAGGAPMP